MKTIGMGSGALLQVHLVAGLALSLAAGCSGAGGPVEAANDSESAGALDAELSSATAAVASPPPALTSPTSKAFGFGFASGEEGWMPVAQAAGELKRDIEWQHLGWLGFHRQDEPTLQPSSKPAVWLGRTTTYEKDEEEGGGFGLDYDHAYSAFWGQRSNVNGGVVGALVLRGSGARDSSHAWPDGQRNLGWYTKLTGLAPNRTFDLRASVAVVTTNPWSMGLFEDAVKESTKDQQRSFLRVAASDRAPEFHSGDPTTDDGRDGSWVQYTKEYADFVKDSDPYALSTGIDSEHYLNLNLGKARARCEASSQCAVLGRANYLPNEQVAATNTGRFTLPRPGVHVSPVRVRADANGNLWVYLLVSPQVNEDWEPSRLNIAFDDVQLSLTAVP